MEGKSEQEIYSYMIYDRQTRIRQNNKRIGELLNKLTNDIKYQKCFDLIHKLKQRQHMIESQLAEQEREYTEKYKDRVLLSNSNQIQLIVDTIAEKEEKIELVDIMHELVQKNGRVSRIRLFQKWHKHRKQSLQEELGEQPFIGAELIYFVKIYHEVLSKQKKRFPICISEQEKIQLSFDYYHSMKEQLLMKKEQKEEYFIERRNFIVSYFKQKLDAKEKLTIIGEQLDMLNPYLENLLEERVKIEQEINMLEQLNQGYAEQISKLSEISIESETNRKKNHQKVIQVSKYYSNRKAG